MTKADPAERFAGNVQRILAEEDRTPAWLARNAEMSANTLRYQLSHPSALTLRTSMRVASALGRPVDELAA